MILFKEKSKRKNVRGFKKEFFSQIDKIYGLQKPCNKYTNYGHIHKYTYMCMYICKPFELLLCYLIYHNNDDDYEKG